MTESLMARVFQRAGRLDRGDLWFSDAPAQRTRPRFLGLWLYNVIAAALLLWQAGLWWTSTRHVENPVQQVASTTDEPASPVTAERSPELLPDTADLLLDTDMLALWQPVEPLPVEPYRAAAEPVEPNEPAPVVAAPQPDPTPQPNPIPAAEAAPVRPQTLTASVATQPPAAVSALQPIAPDDIQLGLTRAEALYRADDAVTAYYILRQLAEQAPDNSRIRELHGRLLVQDAAFTQLIERLAPPRTLVELEMLAFAWYQTGDYRSSVQGYRRLLADHRAPQPEWMLWLAIGSEQLSELEQAQQWYRQFLSRRQGQPESLVAFAQDRLRILAP